MTSKEIVAVIKGAFVSMNKDCEESFNQIERDLEILEFIKTHYEMNGFNELIPLYLEYDDDERFNELKRWLENEYLIVNYNELNDGGFDLSVRINEEKFNTTEEINKLMDERLAELKQDKTDSIVYVPGKDLLGRHYNIVVQRKATKINV